MLTLLWGGRNWHYSQRNGLQPFVQRGEVIQHPLRQKSRRRDDYIGCLQRLLHVTETAVNLLWWTKAFQARDAPFPTLRPRAELEVRIDQMNPIAGKEKVVQAKDRRVPERDHQWY